MAEMGSVIIHSWLMLAFVNGNTAWQSLWSRYRSAGRMQVHSVHIYLGSMVGSKVISVASELIFGSCDMLLITRTASAFTSILHGHSLSPIPIAAQVGKW